MSPTKVRVRKEWDLEMWDVVTCGIQRFESIDPLEHSGMKEVVHSFRPPPPPVKGSRSDLLDDDVEDSASPESMHCRPQDPSSPYLLATRQITRVNSAKEALSLLESTDT